MKAGTQPDRHRKPYFGSIFEAIIILSPGLVTGLNQPLIYKGLGPKI